DGQHCHERQSAAHTGYPVGCEPAVHKKLLQKKAQSVGLKLLKRLMAIPGTRFHIKNRGLRFGRAGPAGPPSPKAYTLRLGSTVSPFFITFWRKKGQCDQASRSFLT